MKKRNITALLIFLFGVNASTDAKADWFEKAKDFIKSRGSAREGATGRTLSDFEAGDCLMDVSKKESGSEQFFYKIISKKGKGYVYRILMVDRSPFKDLAEGEWDIPIYYDGPETRDSDYIKIPCKEVPEKKTKKK